MWTHLERKMVTTNDFLKLLQVCLSVGGISVQSCVSAHRLMVFGAALGQSIADDCAVILGDTESLGID
jgi:hypothetical protein